MKLLKNDEEWNLSMLVYADEFVAESKYDLRMIMCNKDDSEHKRFESGVLKIVSWDVNLNLNMW